MTPQEFLAAVLPPPENGYYCAVSIEGESPNEIVKQRFLNVAESMLPIARRWAESSKNAYFALATFKESGTRKADNAERIQCIAIDMDGYATKREAAEVLDKFLASTGLVKLGLPIINTSGGGLHCYWPFSRPLGVTEWKPVAEAFKKLCLQEGMRIDMSVTADAARILRTPDTYNFKSKYGAPRVVKTLSDGHGWPFDFSTFSDHVRRVLKAPVAVTAPAPLMLAGQRPKAADDATALSLVGNSEVLFRDILKATSAGDGCAQLAYYVEHAKDDGMEPLWRALLSQAKYCSDKDKAVVWLSKLHPYDEDRRERKLKEIKGPYPCVKFDTENPGVCTKCKFFGKITNPLSFGRNVVTTTEEKEIEILPADPEDPNAPVVKVIRPVPPKGYSYGQNGGVFVEREIEEADGTKRKHNMMLLPYDIFIADLLNKDGEHTIHMVANRPGKPVDVLIPQRYAVSKDELLKTLAQQNIIAAFGAGNDKNLYEYVRACVESASTNKVPVMIPQQYGWQEDGSFVYSGQVFFPDGRKRTVPMPDLVNLTRVTRAKGSLEEWKRFPQLLIRRGLFGHLAIACMAFGSPLMHFTQFSALTIHGGSTTSGTGKSLALSLLSSVWGHPMRYRTGKSTSPVTMQQRMGNLNSLPFTSDEITHKSRHDMEWFPGLVFDASEGQGKEKSETHHNKERINNTSWSLLAFFTSNTLMHDYMSGVRAHTSQGELFRMLEWVPLEALNWNPEEEEVLKVLHDNHGVAGQKFLSWLVQNQALANNITIQSIARLKRDWGMSGDERFWAAGCGAIVAGAVLASSRYADVIDLPVDAIIDFLFTLVKRGRTAIKAGSRNAEDVLNAFTRDNYGNFVVMRIDDKTRKLMAAMGGGEPVDETLTRSKVMGRVEHEITKQGQIEYFIEETILKAHCVSMSFSYETFKEQIRMRPGYTVQYLRKDMMAKTRGPHMRVKAISISRPVAFEEEIEQTENVKNLSVD